MSGSLDLVNPDSSNTGNEALIQRKPEQVPRHKNYKGFVAGVFSGIAKLSGNSPSPGVFRAKLTERHSGTSVCLFFSSW